ncbi:oligosaccharide flippase family protein [Phenylobacterium sp.]|uniref:oligosaccharide flippase family protein n=1 Tax=Phenylobacterium sp. TaxID=1871053 RepID=UPI002810EB3C|nr:oligosaccharide flippase family protein [Phenylobacterium sp.]
MSGGRSLASRLRRFLGKLTAADRLGYAALQSILLQAAGLLINFVTGVITARALGVEGRGVYAAATAWATLLSSAAVIGFADAVLIHVRKAPAQSRALFLCGAVAALLLATVMCLAAFVAMPLLLGRHGAAALDLARASLILAHVTAVGMIMRQVFAGRGRYLAANLAAFLPFLGHALLLVSCLVWGRLDVPAAVASVIGGTFLAVLALAPSLLRELHGPVSEMRQAWVALLAFARRTAPADLFALGTAWADRLILIPLLPAAQLGIYVVAANLSRILIVFTPATGILLSAMSAQERERSAELHHLALRLTIASYLPLVAVTLLVDRFVMIVFYGSEFLAAVPVFRILVIEAVLNRMATVSSQLYLSLGRPTLNSVIRGLELALVLVLMVVLAPSHGPMGAALALLAGTVLRLALLWGGLITHLHLSFPRLWLERSDLVGMKAAFK